MSDSGYKSLYSVFIFLLAFSIINFYAKKVREEKLFKLEHQKMKNLLKAQKGKEAQGEVKTIWNDISICFDYHEFNCHRLDIFLLNKNWKEMA